jgi:hypothetical protein
MRRLVFLIVLLALAMPVSLASAKHAPVNHVFGDVTLEFFSPSITVQITFDVTGDPLSSVASGSFRQHTFGEGVDDDFTGSVDCLRVVGNTAYISGFVTASSYLPVGTPFYSSMVDASPDGTGDMIGPTFVDLTGTGGLTCADTEPAGNVITSGNVVIEQCQKVTGSGKCKTKD